MTHSLYFPPVSDGEEDPEKKKEEVEDKEDEEEKKEESEKPTLEEVVKQEIGDIKAENKRLQNLVTSLHERHHALSLRVCYNSYTSEPGHQST